MTANSSDPSSKSAVDQWKHGLESLAVPQHILDAAPQSPWSFSIGPFVKRAEIALEGPPRGAAKHALAALPEGGSVLDIGAGAGAGSLPLASKASLLIAVDATEQMLEEYQRLAKPLGVKTQVIHGVWQEVSSKAPVADVGLSVHVLYNVPDLEVFFAPVPEKVRLRMAIEISEDHPFAWLTDLWLKFHDFDMPKGPNAATLEQALSELGIDVHTEQETRPNLFGHPMREDVIAAIRQRLCLPAERDEEIADALGGRLRKNEEGLWAAGPETRTAVTMWWDFKEAD